MKRRILVMAAIILTFGAIALADLRYPGDCDSATLRRAATTGDCFVESGGNHLTVKKRERVRERVREGGREVERERVVERVITQIPHTVYENNTCRSIIRVLNEECNP